MELLPRFAVVLLCFVALFNGAFGDDCHTPAKDIGDEAGLASDICTLTTALKRSPPDYLTASGYYRFGEASLDTKLIDIASGDDLKGAFVKASTELFGSASWMDDLLQAAFNGTGIFETMDDLRRATFIEKLLQGGALSHQLFSNLQRSYANAKIGKTGKATAFTERAMANFFGTESECSIFGTGQLRGQEFGTMSDGASAANGATVGHFAAIVEAIEGEKVKKKAFRKARADIEKQLITIYLQCCMKYLTKMSNNDDILEAQAEGFGYYHAIAAQVNLASTDVHDKIYAALDISKDPTVKKAKKGRKAILEVLELLGISEEDFGTYDPAGRDNYKPPNSAACFAINPYEGATVELVDFDR